MIELTGEKILEFYDQGEYQKALALVMRNQKQIAGWLRFIGINPNTRAQLITQRTILEQMFQILNKKIAEHNWSEARKKQQRIAERSERIELAKRFSGPINSDRYHIDPEILAQAEQAEQLIEWRW